MSSYIHINSQREKVSVETCPGGEFEGQPLLVIHDDAAPYGSGRKAPMLLDRGTACWLAAQFRRLYPEMNQPATVEYQCSSGGKLVASFRFDRELTLDQGRELAKATEAILGRDAWSGITVRPAGLVDTLEAPLSSEEPAAQANARLDDAEPDLLAALKFIMAFYEPDAKAYLDSEAWKRAEAQARAAIAKAEGGAA